MVGRALTVSDRNIAEATGAIVAADTRTADGRVVLRKGALLGEEHLPALRALVGREIHLVDLGPGELVQDAVAERLAAALSGPGVLAEPCEQGQARLRAVHQGLLRVDRASVRAVNALPPLLCFTQPDGQVVLPGDEVAGVKSSALATPAEVVERAERVLRAAGPVVTVAPFRARRACVVATERLAARGREMVIAAVERKVRWYGGTLLGVAEVAHEVSAVAAALRAAVRDGADLVFVSGANPLDPLDPALVALAAEGGEVRARGVPAHPGSMVWVAELRAGVPVLGVATCAGFGKNTSLDLVLPRILAGADPTEAAAELGYGGLAEAPSAAGRFPPYDRP